MLEDRIISPRIAALVERGCTVVQNVTNCTWVGVAEDIKDHFGSSNVDGWPGLVKHQFQHVGGRKVDLLGSPNTAESFLTSGGAEFQRPLVVGELLSGGEYSA